LDRAQIFTRVSISFFPRVSNGTLLSDKDVWSPTLSIGSKGHNVLSDLLIALKILLRFPEAVFVRVAVESLFSEKDVWSATLSIGLKGP
jgi:hypothetical protein